MSGGGTNGQPFDLNQFLTQPYQPPTSPNNGMLLPSGTQAPSTPSTGTPFNAYSVNDKTAATDPMPGTPAPTAQPPSAAPATAPQAAPDPFSIQNSVLGSGQNFQAPGSMTQQLGSALQINGGNGIALPPNNYARWQGWQSNPTINTGRAGLNFNTSGYGGSGSTPGGSNPGGGTNPGTINPGGGVSQPGGGITTVTSPPGSVIPGNAPPTGVPNGGFGSPNAPVNAPQTVNGLNQYFKTNYGAANQGNGNGTLTGFRFSTGLASSSPMAQQFNSLMQSGNTNAAYSMLVNDNTGVGTQMLRSAMATNPDLAHQIVSTFAQGGTDAYFGKGVGYDPTSTSTSGGHYDAQGNFVGPQSLAQLQSTNPQAYHDALRAQSFAARGQSARTGLLGK